MATPLQATERQNAFFHSLSKATTNSTQYVFESKYKSAHSVKGSEIWADVISYCADSAAADAEATANAAVEKYTQVTLTEIPGSNGQAWYINNAGTFVRPWISPVDVPNSTTNAPSDGFQANLYTSTGTLVTPTAGVWFVDYYAGIVHFEVGSTPVDLGYGTPKITCYVYTGAYGAGTTGIDFSSYEEVTALENDDFILISRGGSLKKIKVSNVRDYFNPPSDAVMVGDDFIVANGQYVVVP